MIRVLHVITGLGSGGAEAALFKLVSRLDRRRFDCRIVSMGDEGIWGSQLGELGISVTALRMKPRNLGLTGLWRLGREMHRFRPHIVQTWLYHADLLGLLSARITGAPIVVSNLRCADMDLAYYSSLTRLVRWLDSLLSWWPNAVVANSEAGREFHEHALAYRPRRWELIGNGFDTEIFRPNDEARARTRRLLGVDDDVVLIGMVARWDPMKDHDTFLQAAAELRRRRGNLRFILVGRGMKADNPVLWGRIQEHNLKDAVILLGERHDIAALDAALDVATLVSRFGEGFPNVIGEAMACGVPCVVSDVGDSAKVTGDTGFVVPPRNPSALAAAWERMISLGPAGRRELGKRARKRIEGQFSIEAVTRRYAALYEDLVKRGIGETSKFFDSKSREIHDTHQDD
jgi:glycosyltransferase involved in cell wall biosynthesis